MTAFAVPDTSIEFWKVRLSERGLTAGSAERFGQPVLSFTDPDGLQLEIIGVAEPTGTPWASGPIAVDKAIRGFHSVTIAEEGYENTVRLLTDVMGFAAGDKEKNRFRYRAGGQGDEFASIVDLVCVPGAPQGGMGAGAVHHVAFRTPDDVRQGEWHQELASKAFNVSPVMHRGVFPLDLLSLAGRCAV